LIAEQLPALQIMVPLIAAPLCVIVRHAKLSWALAMATNVIAFVISVLLLQQVLDTGVIRYAVGGWAAPSGIEYYIDSLNAAVLVLVSGISGVVLVYAYRSVARSVPQTKHYLFYAAWMMCVTGLLGIVITGDAFNVFVFLEISSLAIYTLISFGNDRRALTASFRYLVLGSVGASFILIGIGFLYAATGTLNMIDLAARIPDSESQRSVLVAFSFITLGVLIKSAVFPLHAWLPNAYTHAPVAVTAFLAGTATKVSLYVLLRFFFSIFGKDYSFGQLLLNGVLLPAAVAGFVLMSLVAIFQTDLRRMLAYSSVAQIGYIVAGFSLASQAGLTAGIVHIVNHAIVKASLFMAVGCILYRVGHVHMPSLDSLIKHMPFTCVAFIISGLGLIGVPLTVGFVSKFTLIQATMERGWWIVSALVLLSSLMAVVYVGRVIEVMLFRQSRQVGHESIGMREAPLSMLVPMYLLTVVGVYFGINGSATLNLAGHAAAQLLGGFQ
jgi:multicomponent Na+:H+ antiporter subunit D